MTFPQLMTVNDVKYMINDKKFLTYLWTNISEPMRFLNQPIYFHWQFEARSSSPQYLET
jgi:hypothetical protein